MIPAVGDAKAEGRHGLGRACWRRLVKENDLAHGEFGKWLETVGINDRVARMMMKIVAELDSKRSTYSEIGLEALYQIGTPVFRLYRIRCPQDKRENS